MAFNVNTDKKGNKIHAENTKKLNLSNHETLSLFSVCTKEKLIYMLTQTYRETHAANQQKKI